MEETIKSLIQSSGIFNVDDPMTRAEVMEEVMETLNEEPKSHDVDEADESEKASVVLKKYSTLAGLAGSIVIPNMTGMMQNMTEIKLNPKFGLTIPTLNDVENNSSTAFNNPDGYGIKANYNPSKDVIDAFSYALAANQTQEEINNGRLVVDWEGIANQYGWPKSDSALENEIQKIKMSAFDKFHLLVKCKDNSGYEEHLTVGLKYRAKWEESTNDDMVVVLLDDGGTITVFEDRFEILSTEN